MLLQLRTEVNKVLETARTRKMIGSSLEAKLYLHGSSDRLVSRLAAMCSSSSENEADSLNRILLTSQVEILGSLENVNRLDIPCTGECLVDDTDRIWIGVSLAEGSKCERCWNFSLDVGRCSDHPMLCARCHGVITSQQLLPVLEVAGAVN
ncbi:hypothetical protein M569_04354 [Genlisea aurea]|uniref:Zinc finger FPG/IleRS-type domain-containing protein n=1 Tax=Genlisea aurea TaxID=192259 RepID=S8ED07_9LAMI|nr:hypothetical protein M569_04354 [Genlisea aurea]